mmetsp:Transcript_44042/g.49354  ORF Transcript_44042/g.49354 Transcript_44042/m.49354 type:complete len:204 (-) Transcript_44042:2443-3054(-)
MILVTFTPAASLSANRNRLWYDRSLFPPGIISSTSSKFDLFEYCLLPDPSPESPMISKISTVLLRPFTMSELVLYPSTRINCSARVDFCEPTVARLSVKPTREPVETSSTSGPSNATRRFRSIAIAASIFEDSDILHNSSHCRVISHKAFMCTSFFKSPHAAKDRVNNARRLTVSCSSNNNFAYFRTYGGLVKKLECFLKPSS